ncbi:dna replication factor c subunit [Vairimorpha apis BRL 01]|uniref:Dna replication factor c subunit n=1 Tax=Vairimorpha apis BRL 01 TaxID=1037528 RepID=T0MFG9_9MICR|nr:dna replication factor c subunit [Vairimorpha apis BRL 01]
MLNFFKNKTVVFTGELSLNRDYAKSQIILLGGKCTNAISGKTDILVVGVEPGPVKLKKANDMNIKIMYEPEFVMRIKESMKTVNVSVDIDKRNTGMVKAYDDDLSKDELLSNYSTWAEKYRPKNKKDIIGNQNIVNQLEDFLLGNTKFKGALLSGSPGIGKTSSVMVLCKELNFDLIEFNASDVRNKFLIISKIKGLINTKSLSFTGEPKKKVILMDEVDGMTSDRGGLQELNSLIKTSLVPIVCICNDRNNLKIRTLANNCLDLKFRKLDSRSIINRLRKILEIEKKK